MSESAASGWPEIGPIDDDAARTVLREGDVEVIGRMPWSSNATFLVCLSLGRDQLLAIYKPQRGERPLWDFPRGTLCNREVAAREVSEQLGWDIVPDTVLAGDEAEPADLDAEGAAPTLASRDREVGIALQSLRSRDRLAAQHGATAPL